MRQHTEIGGGILSGVGFLRDAADVPRCHHEAWNGTGYPHGLMGEKIPLNARIFAVVDTYDAIRSERPYKKAQPHHEAIELIRQASEVRLDPRLVELFCSEPEATWGRLDQSVAGSITFEGSLQACQKIAAP
jgi:HD-GYP domain-containing protein (c-di-GMP phosphodiesterase class II)